MTDPTHPFMKLCGPEFDPLTLSQSAAVVADAVTNAVVRRALISRLLKRDWRGGAHDDR